MRWQPSCRIDGLCGFQDIPAADGIAALFHGTAGQEVNGTAEEGFKLFGHADEAESGCSAGLELHQQVDVAVGPEVLAEC